MAGRLDGKVARISGAARGIGEAHAQLFADEGASVVVADVLVEPREALDGRLRGGRRNAIFKKLRVQPKLLLLFQDNAQPCGYP